MNGKNGTKFKWAKDIIYIIVLVIGLISSWLANKYRTDNMENRVIKLEHQLETVNLGTLQYQVKDINKKVDDFTKKFDTFIADYYRNR